MNWICIFSGTISVAFFAFSSVVHEHDHGGGDNHGVPDKTQRIGDLTEQNERQTGHKYYLRIIVN